MFDSLGVGFAQFLLEGIFVVLVKIEAGFGEDGVLLDDFVEDVDVEGESLSRVELFDEFPTNGAPHPVLVVQEGNAVGAQSMPAVDQDARDPLPHIVLMAAELANVQPPRLIIQICYIHFLNYLKCSSFHINH